MEGVRVAHVVPTDRIAYLLLRARLLRLQEAGFDVSVICGDVGYGERLEECGLRVLHIPFAREIAPWTDLRCLRALRQTLRRERVEIAHSHNPKGTLLGPLAARLAGVPIVAHTVHGFLFNENSRGLHRLARSAPSAGVPAGAIICSSRAVRILPTPGSGGLKSQSGCT